jgi:hypothetical protein
VIAAEEVRRFLAGETLRYCANPEVMALAIAAGR